MTTYSPPANLLAERCVLVTGAGDGIGRTAALAYAQHGANVVLLGRTRTKLEAVFDQIARETQTRPTIVPADLQYLTEESATALRQGIERDYGRLDGILHNASLLGPRNPIEHYPAADWHAVMQVNVNAAFLLTRALLPLLGQAEDASIILTSSGVGRKGRAYWGAYAVSKFATEGLMGVLADECAHAARIRVNSLNPGATRTTMRATAYPNEDPRTLPTPESHMPLYLYLMGPDSKGITGQRFDAASWGWPMVSIQGTPGGFGNAGEAASNQVAEGPMLKGESLAVLDDQEKATTPTPPAMDTQEDVLSATGAASLLGVADSTVARCVRNNEMVGFRSSDGSLCIPREQFANGAVIEGIPDVLAMFAEESSKPGSRVNHREAWSFLCTSLYPGDIAPRPLDRLQAGARRNALPAVVAELARAKVSLDFGDHI